MSSPPLGPAAAATQPGPVTTQPVSTPALHRSWPGRLDRGGQAALAAGGLLVGAAMVWNHRHVGDPGTWTADAVALALLAALGLGHSQLRRGRPGRWPVAVAVVVLLGVPLLAV